MTLFKHTTQIIDDLNEILITIFCFVDDFIKRILHTLRFAIEPPNQNRPPVKSYSLSVAELVSLAIFRYFTGHTNWKDFYRHIMTYHLSDFPELPNYQNFLAAANRLSSLATILLQGFMHVFKRTTNIKDLKFTDGMALKVCENKRIFSHKTCAGLAKRSKSSMGWFYGFKLHIICNELMQILGLKITAGNVDERKALAMIWGDIFGVIIADAGYVGKQWFEKAKNLGKFLFTAVRANMKKLMTETEHELLKLRQKVETVFSVLKLRMGIESTLPRSPLGYYAHYIWCITAYQFKKYVEYASTKPLLA